MSEARSCTWRIRPGSAGAAVGAATASVAAGGAGAAVTGARRPLSASSFISGSLSSGLATAAPALIAIAAARTSQRAGRRGEGGGFASARSIGEPSATESTSKTPRFTSYFCRLHEALGYRRRRHRKHRRGAPCSRPCCSKRTKAAFAPASARSTKPACPKAMSVRRSRTRRSTSRTAWRSPTAARWCAPGRWSPASTAPAPCSKSAMPTGSRATASCTTAGAWARRAGAASPSAPA